MTMFPSMRSVARCIVVALILVAIPLATGLLKSSGTPYRSALSTLGPDMALAAPGCSMQICEVPKGSKPAACLASTLSYNCSKSGGHCTSTPC
jgi:hypothetical protein